VSPTHSPRFTLKSRICPRQPGTVRWHAAGSGTDRREYGKPGRMRNPRFRTRRRLSVRQRKRWPPCRPAALPPCRLAALPPCRLAALPPCRLAALPPCRPAALPPCRPAALLLGLNESFDSSRGPLSPDILLWWRERSPPRHSVALCRPRCRCPPRFAGLFFGDYTADDLIALLVLGRWGARRRTMVPARPIPSPRGQSRLASPTSGSAVTQLGGGRAGRLRRRPQPGRRSAAGAAARRGRRWRRLLRHGVAGACRRRSL